MALPLGIQRLLQVRCGERGDIYVRASVLLFLVILSAMLTDIGLTFDNSRYWTIVFSSAAVAMQVAVTYFLQSSGTRRSSSTCTDVTLAGDRTPLTIITCTIEKTEMVLLEGVIIDEDKLHGGRFESSGSPVTTSAPSNIDESSGTLDSHPKDWYYIDLQNTVQGPFSSKVMREWYEANLLQPDLLVANDPSPFVPLRERFTEDPFLDQ